MSLINLVQSVSAAKVEKSFNFHGTEYKFYVRELSASEVESIGERQLKGKNKDGDINFRSRMIASAVEGLDGEKLGLEQCRRMPNALSMKFWKAVSEVNDFTADEDDEAGKPSPATTDDD